MSDTQDIIFKVTNYQDKDNLVLSLANNGYKVSVRYVERRLWDISHPYWAVTVHGYMDEGLGYPLVANLLREQTRSNDEQKEEHANQP